MAGVAVPVNSAFSSPAVRLEAGTLRVHCDLANQSSEAWSAALGFAAGYHLFDEPTGTLVVDGARTPLDLAPAARRSLDLEIPLPPEPGHYDICISVMREQVAWFYTKGWPFLLAQVTVADNGVATLNGWRITVQSSMARKRMLRGFGRAFSTPLAAVWSNRGLIRTLVRRDVLSRYSGSFGGAFWAVLNPLLLMLTYFFVFGIVLNSRFPGDPSRSGFALYYLAGFLPWLAFSEAVGRAPTTLVEHRNFIKKLVFPVEILPFDLMVSGLVTEFFGVIIFALALLLLRGHLPATALYLPLLLIPQVLLPPASAGSSPRSASSSATSPRSTAFSSPSGSSSRRSVTPKPAGSPCQAMSPASFRRTRSTSWSTPTARSSSNPGLRTGSRSAGSQSPRHLCSWRATRGSISCANPSRTSFENCPGATGPFVHFVYWAHCCLLQHRSHLSSSSSFDPRPVSVV